MIFSCTDPLFLIDFNTTKTPTTITVILPDPDLTNPTDSVVIIVTQEDDTNDVVGKIVSHFRKRTICEYVDLSLDNDVFV